MDASLRRGPARRLLTLTAGICAIALAGGCAGPGVAGSGSASSAVTTEAAAAQRSTNELQTDYETVIRNVLPSVVQIDAGNSLGSGVIYDNQGHIVTNAHVVGKQRAFAVTMATREQPMKARLVSSFPQQDLAVIKLEQVPKGLKAAKFGDTSQVAVGQIVLAMGSPLGLSGSVTQGIVSAVGRTVSESPAGGTGATIPNMVQTSAAINPGNSGGALVNLDSQVIGIPTLAATDPQLGDSAAPGIGFAIPVSMVKTVADQIIKNGKVTNSGRAALGISGRTVLGDNLQPAGVAVVKTLKGSAAAAAGIRTGDIIVKVGNSAVTSITSLSEVLAAAKPGQKVKVTYVRGGDTKTAEVKLGEM
ncbi:S1C family serine protease [Streptomyces sp. AK02-01A]|uniref:S1C family serine protease n=1 Tax=Streptomyces sp. AK02-01A TaxID=3028648 RepID=UPI0029B00E62|nr:trypsin-like peptidase domain-containing protein [Streptomyces sp. AK02-01A]MDX3855485.1 trypsin-like peptidase domain-containing protein [Streptomyces sp. AK02-01A]